MKRTKEWRISELDEFDDIQDVHYFDSEQEARKELQAIRDEKPGAAGWLLELNTRAYHSDGELVEDEYIELKI